jgi:hypothetical protein
LERMYAMWFSIGLLFFFHKDTLFIGLTGVIDLIQAVSFLRCVR